MREVGRAVAAVALLLSACGGDDPESALTQLVKETEKAAESRDTGYFRRLIADGYVDQRGSDRERLLDAIRGYFLTNPDIEVVTRVDSVELLGRDAARLVVLAGILSRRPGGGVLGGIDGRLYRLDLELVESGGAWQIIGARWERSLETLAGD